MIKLCEWIVLLRRIFAISTLLSYFGAVSCELVFKLEELREAAKHRAREGLTQ